MSFPDNFPLPQGYYPQNNINYFDLSAPFPEEEFNYLEDHPAKKICVEKVPEMDVISQDAPPISQASVNISKVNTQATEHLITIDYFKTACALKQKKINELAGHIDELKSQQTKYIDTIRKLEAKVAKNQDVIAEQKIQATKYADELEAQLRDNQKKIKELSAKESVHLDKIKALETTIAENQKRMEELKSEATNYIQQLHAELGKNTDKIRSLEVERGFHVNRIRESENKIKELENTNSGKESRLNIYREMVRGLVFRNAQLKNNNSILANKCVEKQEYIDQIELTPQYNFK